MNKAAARAGTSPAITRYNTGSFLTESSPVYNKKMRSPLLAVLLLSCLGPLSAQDDDITWLGSYQEALQVAKKTGKPIFLEYRCEP